MNYANDYFISHFGKKVVKALVAKGIVPVSATYLPDANGDFSNGETGYCIENNGEHQVRTYRQIREMAA